MLCFFFFFKQKTAYEMRISDWSSDVCSSDLADALRRAVGDADAHDGKARAQASLRSPTPTDLSPFCVVEHGVGGARCGVRNVVLTGTLASRHGEDQLHISGINILVPWDADRPVQASCAQPLRSEEHTSELQSLMRISYAAFCLKK